MKIISKKTAYFQSDEPFTFNLEEYGCKLHIQKGSIKEGDKGMMEIYVIHSGDFQLKKGMELVSAIYYVSLSHELLKPATLEIEHCSNVIYNESGNCNLSFITISNTTSGPPYCFETIEGGIFNSGHWGTIQRSQFSGYAVAFLNWIRGLLGWNLGILYFLITSGFDDDSHVFNVRLILTKYLVAHQEV